jgi:hypothetical protein
MKIRIISLYTNTDEHFQKDDGKVYFTFFDDEGRTWYTGAVTYEELFGLLKPRLREERG